MSVRFAQRAALRAELFQFGWRTVDQRVFEVEAAWWVGVQSPDRESRSAAGLAARRTGARSTGGIRASHRGQVADPPDEIRERTHQFHRRDDAADGPAREATRRTFTLDYNVIR
jgi:hypothetical protein